MVNRIEPKLHFSSWKEWSFREMTRRDDFFDVPKSFDVPAVYLFAYFKSKKQMKDNNSELRYLNPSVIYIGQSTRIIHRLEDHEKVTKEYIRKYKDTACKYLYHSISYPEWHPLAAKDAEVGIVRKAWLHYIERKMIWEYAKLHSKIPSLNKY